MSKSSKKLLSGNCTKPYKILQILDTRFYTSYGLGQSLEIKKQNLNYWLKKLKSEGLVNNPHRGIWNITDLGKKILRGFEKQQGKELVRLENMRYRFPIVKNFNYLLLNFIWNDVTTLNHLNIIHVKIWGFTTRIICGLNPSIEISCHQKLGTNIYEMMYEAKEDAIAIARIFEEDHKVVLGDLEPAMEPEWAIPSQLSEALLSLSCSSQIRSKEGTLNRSKGRNADIEVRDPRYAQILLELPQRIVRLERIMTLHGFPCSFL